MQKRYLIHVAGYNLGLILRLLTGAGTPREFRAASAWLFATVEPDGGLLVFIFVAIGEQFATCAFTARPHPSG